MDEVVVEPLQVEQFKFLVYVVQVFIYLLDEVLRVEFPRHHLIVRRFEDTVACHYHLPRENNLSGMEELILAPYLVRNLVQYTDDTVLEYLVRFILVLDELACVVT